MTTPSGRISNGPEERERERKKEREKMTFIMATYVYASSQGLDSAGDSHEGFDDVVCHEKKDIEK